MSLLPDAIPFPPYEKIAESLAAWLGEDEAGYRAASRVEWVVSEKIHGANFCMVTNGEAVRCAKRKGFLAEDEDFFGHRALLPQLAPAVRALHAAVRREDAKVALVYVYGELCGGGYPHPDVPPVPGVAPVQTGCWYTPGIELFVFDVGVLRDGTRERAYLDQDTAARLCQGAGLRVVQPLLRGLYEEASAHPLGFETTVPALLGLPSLGPANKAEGVVIKPVAPIVVPRRAGWIRPVIKRKIAEFAEDERFHGARKWTPAPATPHGALDALKTRVSALCNENRLAAAVSKVGRVESGDRGRLAEVLGLVREDLETELRQGEGALLAALSPADAAALARFLDGEARALVELYLGAPPP